MRTTRLLGAVAAAAVVAIAPLSATIAAADEPTGVGVGTVGSTLLKVDVGPGGNILSVAVLGDGGTSTIDPANGQPHASTSLSPLTISSGLAPALNTSVPPVSTSSTGDEDTMSVSPALPGNPAFAGALTARLSSIVDAAGARSGLEAGVANLDLAGGLLHLPSGTVSLATSAVGGQSTAVRSVSIPAIEVLNLAAVLEGVGLPLDSLSVDTVLDLLRGLGIALPDIPDPAAVLESVDDALDTLQGQSGALTAELCAAVDQVLADVGGLAGVGAVGDAAQEIIDNVGGVGGGQTPGSGTPSLPLPVPVPGLQAKALPVTCDSLTGTVQQLVTDLRKVVAGLAQSVLESLGDTALLSVHGIEIGVLTDARPTVEDSVARVTGTIGSVKVGNLAVPGVSGLDLTAPAAVLNAAADSVNAAVADILGLVNAQLADMVDVDVLRITELVEPDGDYAKATASVTALTATLTPPNLLGAAALDLEGTVGGLLGQVSGTVPALAPALAQLEVALGGLDLLTAPTTITVGSITSSSSFRPAAAGTSGPGSTPTGGSPTPGGELPRTGSDAALPAIAAVLVAGVALGIRRFVAAVTAA